MRRVRGQRIALGSGTGGAVGYTERGSKFFYPGAPIRGTTQLRKELEWFSQIISNSSAIEARVRNHQLEEAPLLECRSRSALQFGSFREF